VFLQLSDEPIQVIAHQEEFVAAAICFRRMHGKLGWGQPEDEPIFPNINVGEFKHVTEEGTVSLGVRAVNNRMRTNNHSSFVRQTFN
jgi:hypothetical protein